MMEFAADPVIASPDVKGDSLSSTGPFFARGRSEDRSTTAVEDS